MQEKNIVSGKVFKQHFEIIYNKFLECADKNLWAHSEIGFWKFLGHENEGRVRAWKKGQWPARDDCWTLHKKLGCNLNWIVSGEGEPFQHKECVETATEYKDKIARLEKQLLEMQERLEKETTINTLQAKLLSEYEEKLKAFGFKPHETAQNVALSAPASPDATQRNHQSSEARHE